MRNTRHERFFAPSEASSSKTDRQRMSSAGRVDCTKGTDCSCPLLSIIDQASSTAMVSVCQQIYYTSVVFICARWSGSQNVSSFYFISRSQLSSDALSAVGPISTVVFPCSFALCGPQNSQVVEHTLMQPSVKQVAFFFCTILSNCSYKCVVYA